MQSHGNNLFDTMKSSRGQSGMPLAILQNLHRQSASYLILIFLSVACGGTTDPLHEPIAASNAMIPLPVSDAPTGEIFILTEETSVYVSPDIQALREVGEYLAEKLRPATGYGIGILPRGDDNPPKGSICLSINDRDPSLGQEGYTLHITEEQVVLSADTPEGVFRGIQTLRQALPPSIEESMIQPGPWQVATRTVRDFPRFAWRGAMLDVARHFFSVEEVKGVIDLLAYYKINRFHLHLTDDQGWRLMIHSWPNLAIYGGSTEVGGGCGGYYSQADYVDLVAYAESRYMMLIPEIDMPGHTNAALASYAELNEDGIAPPLYTGRAVGFSALAVNNEITYTFIDDVIQEIAALTPGPYIHIGGDEAFQVSEEEYAAFILRVDGIVQSHGKQMIGWEEIAEADVSSPSMAQHWADEAQARIAAQKGMKIIMSPATRAYLDMKYNWFAPLIGGFWAGFINVQDAYTWDPASQVGGLEEQMIVGVEAPLWTEFVQNIEEIEFMVYPRLAGYAEIGWSPESERDWDGYRIRLGAHGARWDAMDVNYYRSPLIPWGDSDPSVLKDKR